MLPASVWGDACERGGREGREDGLDYVGGCDGQTVGVQGEVRGLVLESEGVD